LVERLVRNEKVRGSNPLTSTTQIVLVIVLVVVIDSGWVGLESRNPALRTFGLA
jgi:hypothetical protein